MKDEDIGAALNVATKRMDELQKENNSLRTTHEFYKQAADEIEEVVETFKRAGLQGQAVTKLAAIPPKLDPFRVGGMKPGVRKYTKLTPYIQELTAMCRGGTTLSSEFIRTIYDDELTAQQALTILRVIGKSAGFERRREGRKVYVYAV